MNKYIATTRKVTLWVPAAIAIAAMAASPTSATDWPRFRGPGGRGVLQTGKSVGPILSAEHPSWKVPLVGRGASSPVTIAERVFVTASGPAQDRLHVLCFDSQTGKELWHRQLWATGHTIVNPFSAVAASTPACVADRVVVQYSSNDVACFDFDGNLLWLRGLAFERPLLRNDVGMASSPAIVGETVVIQADSRGDALLVGLDLNDGSTRWIRDRQKEAMWSSPIPYPVDGSKTVVLVQSREALEAIDPRTGKTIANFGHFCDTIPTATWEGETIFLPAAGLYALRAPQGGETMEELWFTERLSMGNASPAADAGRVYVIRNPGILACADAQSGRVTTQIRLGGRFWASPVIVDDYLYAVNYEGTVFVVRLGEKPEKVGEFTWESNILASPAADESGLYLRSDRFLVKLPYPEKQ
ncbi:MAG: pyrrolo-quinoline quinone [Planctomycetota bacterium]|nr:MAG: pyrrolo-quinoline quinone [Planctomycetota bacterium]